MPFKVDTLFVLLLAAWAVITALEARFPAARGQKPFTRHSLTDFIGMGVNKAVMGPGAVALYTMLELHVLKPYAPHNALSAAVDGWPAAAQFMAACFLFDLAQYLRHRFTHAFLWGFHATHHSAVELRSSVHWRLHPVDYVFIALVDPAILFMLGFSGKAIVLARAFMALNNLWLHANLDVGYGPLRFVFASPNYHKWHHAREKEAIDRNFADLFVILDVLGGTYHAPERRPEAFGVYGAAEDDPLHRGYLGPLFYPLRRLKSLFPPARS